MLNWKSYSRLIIKSDSSNWVLRSIAREMELISTALNIKTINPLFRNFIKRQCLFYTSKYDVLLNWTTPKNRIAFPYYHGDPSKHKEFYHMIKNIKKHHSHISRIQVSHTKMEETILNTGIDEDKVFRIPISISLGKFPLRDKITKIASRNKLNIPKNSILIGSFQKDGDGWGEGMNPKLIKGPDVFIKTIKILKNNFPNIMVLLTGPSRGYVKNCLEKINVPYIHLLLNDYDKIISCYHAIDLYLITSREEGGPRAILESMATGVPLVTTRVGQAVDLVKHKINGWMVDVEDVDGLAHYSKYVLSNLDQLKSIKLNGRKTAKNNCYDSQLPLWKNFMNGFLDFQNNE